MTMQQKPGYGETALELFKKFAPGVLGGFILWMIILGFVVVALD